MVEGSCLCGVIQFQAEELPNMTFNCHCSRCRKSHGSAFATQVLAVKNSLQFHKGKEFLTEYQSTGGIRTFCSKCGSRLMNYGNEGIDYLSIAISAIDNSSSLYPVGDCFVINKFDWTPLAESIAKYDALPEF